MLWGKQHTYTADTALSMLLEQFLAHSKTNTANIACSILFLFLEGTTSQENESIESAMFAEYAIYGMG